MPKKYTRWERAPLRPRRNLLGTSSADIPEGQVCDLRIPWRPPSRSGARDPDSEEEDTESSDDEEESTGDESVVARSAFSRASGQPVDDTTAPRPLNFPPPPSSRSGTAFAPSTRGQHPGGHVTANSGRQLPPQRPLGSEYGPNFPRQYSSSQQSYQASRATSTFSSSGGRRVPMGSGSNAPPPIIPECAARPPFGVRGPADSMPPRQQSQRSRDTAFASGPARSQQGIDTGFGPGYGATTQPNSQQRGSETPYYGSPLPRSTPVAPSSQYDTGNPFAANYRPPMAPPFSNYGSGSSVPQHGTELPFRGTGPANPMFVPPETFRSANMPQQSGGKSTGTRGTKGSGHQTRATAQSAYVPGFPPPPRPTCTDEQSLPSARRKTKSKSIFGKPESSAAAHTRLFPTMQLRLENQRYRHGTSTTGETKEHPDQESRPPASDRPPSPDKLDEKHWGRMSKDHFFNAYLHKMNEVECGTLSKRSKPDSAEQKEYNAKECNAAETFYKSQAESAISLGQFCYGIEGIIADRRRKKGWRNPMIPSHMAAIAKGRLEDDSDIDPRDRQDPDVLKAKMTWKNEQSALSWTDKTMWESIWPEFRDAIVCDPYRPTDTAFEYSMGKWTVAENQKEIQETFSRHFDAIVANESHFLPR